MLKVYEPGSVRLFFGDKEIVGFADGALVEVETDTVEPEPDSLVPEHRVHRGGTITLRLISPGKNDAPADGT